MLSGVERVVKSEAEAGGSPKPPLYEYPETTIPTYNDPKLTARVVDALRQTLGNDRVLEKPPLMVSEDFAAYARDGVPTFLFHVGAVDTSKYQQAMSTGTTLPSLHSSTFAPEYKGTLRTAITAEVSVLMELLPRELTGVVRPPVLDRDTTPDWAGLYHMTCAGETSWYGFTCAILASGLVPGTVRLEAIPTEDYPLPAPRPHNSVLSNQKLANTFGVSLPHWTTALGAMLKLLPAGSHV